MTWHEFLLANAACTYLLIQPDRSTTHISLAYNGRLPIALDALIHRAKHPEKKINKTLSFHIGACRSFAQSRIAQNSRQVCVEFSVGRTFFSRAGKD